MTNPLLQNEADLPQSPFEQIRRIDAEGNEFWSARDLMPLLDYTSWQYFKPVLTKAQIACENSGQNSEDHFVESYKLVAIGSDTERKVEDMHLSRYAYYLIVQNADPKKGVVALGQTYFAVQTHRQEIADETELASLNENQRRLLLRQEIKQQNTDLASAAKRAGVITSVDFAVFQDHGYRGLYNGLAAKEIHRRKKLKASQHILDHMGSAELAANLFRSTQAEEKLRRENTRGKDNANQVHFDAGIMVRNAIKGFGGTMPEDMPSAESIKKLESAEKKRLKTSKPKQSDEQSK